MTYELSLDAARAARARIAPYVRHTPLLPAPALAATPTRPALPPQTQLKLENLQVSGSFKARGVFNTLLQIDPAERERGVITASGGNHGVALAYCACQLGLRAIVYLPERASDDRAARIAAWGAQVIRYGAAWDDADKQARAHAAADQMLYVPPFDAARTVEGQATLGLELLDDVPELDCALIAIGGGGLIAGVSAAIKQLRPHARIIGIEPAGAPSMQHSVALGYVEPLAEVRTIADTLAPRSVSDRTLALAQRYVDEIVLVDDLQMVEAMRWLWVECNQLVEPAGAAVLAALLYGAADLRGAAHPVALICGGNAAAESVFATYAQAAQKTAHS